MGPFFVGTVKPFGPGTLLFLMGDPFNLERFVEAQAPIYFQVCQELRLGQKRTHWMWFVFPQLKELGQSAMAQRYGIGSWEEAQAYLSHPVLGTRLHECTDIVNSLVGTTAGQIFGYPDDMKFRSCMTLFSEVSEGPSIFENALQNYFEGEPDPATLELL